MDNNISLKQASKTSFRDWLLISACVMIFVVLPLLFAWNSMSMIHNRVYGEGYVFSTEPIVKKAHITHVSDSHS